MSTFILIHGGGHRGWHWSLVRPLLESAGHDVLTPDVPMDDPNAGTEVWAQVVAEVVRGKSTGDMLLVGHSLAGLLLPVLAEVVPARRLVFVAANVPVPGMAYTDYLREHPEAKTFPWERITQDEFGRNVIDWPLARYAYYHDVDEPLAREAFARCTPVATTGYEETCPLSSWPGVPSSYILCQEDRATAPAWSRQVSIDRLGVPALELPGGHSPFLSHPDLLARALMDVARIP